jgi:outer membrane protein assembly factor BamB
VTVPPRTPTLDFNPMTRNRPQSLRPAATLIGGAALIALLSGCGITDWFDSKDTGPKLAGNRISVLQLEQQLEPDPSVTAREVTLPAAVASTSWHQPGGTTTGNLGNLELGGSLKEIWRTSIEGADTGNRLLSGPIVADGRLYVLDTAYELHAIDAESGRKVWSRDVRRENQEGDAIGGGVAFSDGRLFVTTGFGEVVAVNPADGGVIWRQRIAAPIRSAPTVAGGRVFVVTVANELIVLNAENRVLQWFHTGILESAALLGSSNAAVDNDIVIAPYSSGELVALRVENGRQAWQENLAAVRRGQNLSGLADIRGRPVVDRGLVFAVSHSGQTVAVDQRTGQRVWEQDVGGINAPLVAGDWLFVLSNENQLVCLTRDTGRIRWISQLERYEDPEDRDDPIQWVGPIAGGDRLLLTNNQGELVEIAPQTGEVIRRTELPDSVLVQPVIANKTLYLLTDEGDLIAYR